MLRHIVIKAVFVLLSLTHHSEVVSTETLAEQRAEPAYAKWGKLAMEETIKEYRDASIVDYKYEGRRTLEAGQAEESFVLWVRKDTKEFGVRVRIRIDSSSDSLINVQLKELE